MEQLTALAVGFFGGMLGTAWCCRDEFVAWRERIAAIRASQCTAVEAMHSLATEGMEINRELAKPDSYHFFRGYAKAYGEMTQRIIEPSFTGGRLPSRWRPKHERPQ